MTEASGRLRAAVIGLGFIGAGDPVSGDAIGQKVRDLDGTHAQALAAHPRITLVSGASRDEGRRKRFEERCGVRKTYADWRDMLRDERLDIISVATNSPHHAAITTACAEAGVRAVLCEKPIATRLSDTDRAIHACREHRTLLVVNHNRRWHPLWRAVRQAILDGAIGQVGHAVAHWPTGRLGNVGTHVFDALRMLLGVEAEAVSGTLDPMVPPDCRGQQFHDPGGWGIIAFDGGIRAFVEASHATKGPLLVRIVGSLGQVTIQGGEAQIALWSGATRSLPTPADRPKSLDAAVEDLVECLATGRAPASTGEDGRAALEIIIGFHVSHRLKAQWIPLPICGKDRDLEVQIG